MLEVKNLVFHPLENGLEISIIENVSFTVEPGEMLVITGPNGGGKSTVARLLMGIETPDSGSISLDGVDVTNWSIAQRANAGIGFAFQQPPRFKGMTVKRLLSIATVLAKPHKLCIFDEPEAGIDLWSFSMLVDQFEKLHEEKKESLILISHQEKIIKMADRIMVIRDGKVDALGSKEEILPMLLSGEKDCSCMNPPCRA